MKQISLFILILLSACKTVHKITNESKSTIDSTKVVSKDTIAVAKENNSTEITNLKDINIKINYGDSAVNISDGTVVKHVSIIKAPGSNKISDIVNEAISASGNTGKIPSSIEIHIGTASDSITANSKTDSVNVKVNDSTKLQAEKETYTKNVDKKGLSVGGYLIIIMISLIAIFLVAAKFIK